MNVSGLRQSGPESLHCAERRIEIFHATSAPDRPEAALHLALRKSKQKTVIPGKSFSRR